MRRCWPAALLLIAAQSGAATPELLPDNAAPERYRIELTADPQDHQFDGVATLFFRTLAPTRSVTVNGADLQVSSAVLDGGSSARVSTDARRERLRFEFPAALAVGRHQLQVRYRGRILDTANGLFASEYRGDDGQRRRLLVTQFEPGDARRFAPLWDEPGRKAVFELSVTAPAGQQAISNMPVSAVEPQPDGRVTTRFAPTPRMSSYLLFLALGDLERITRRGEASAATTEIGVVTVRGRSAQGRYALDTSARLLDYYNDYFGIPYALPKLDSIAVAGDASFSAMENWGAILYFDSYLLLDPAVSSEAARQNVFATLAHEMAHQWFGDLVTMRWWDDLWLNEGFASWMETKAATHFHPEWQAWLASDREREAGLDSDAQAGTHPVVQEVLNSTEANLMFDDITYQKGRALVRMIENYVGEDAFRSGVRSYLRAHAFGNTISRDLWNELSAASGQPVEEIARDFTLQAGVPLVRVLATRCDANRQVSVVTLRQERFGLDHASLQPRRWHVPVTAAAGGAVARSVITGPSATQLEVSGCAPVKLNSEQAGYYRVAYDRASLQALQAGFGQLPPADQLGLLDDTLALGLAGLAPLDDYLDLVVRLPDTAAALVQLGLATQLQRLDDYYQELPQRSRWRAFAVATLRPLLQRLGWAAPADEDARQNLLRAALIRTLGTLGDNDVRIEAQRRLAAAASDPGALPPDIYQAALDVAGISTDAQGYAVLRQDALGDTSSLRQRMRLLASARNADAALAQRALEDSLAPDTPTQLTGSLIQTVAAQHPDLAWRFLVAHYDAIAPRLDPTAQLQTAAAVASGRNAAGADRELMRFARSHLPGEAHGALADAAAGIALRQRIRRERLPQIERWLARNAHN
ncbi:MAG: M1 family metallopeptidase [Steroidobacteraceae bacterium]